MRIIKILFIGLAILLLAGCTGGSGGESRVLATAAGAELTLEEFIHNYRNFLNFTNVEDNLMSRSAFVKNEVERLILMNYADTSGFSEKPEVRQSVDASIGQLILNRFYETELAENLEVPDSDIREAFRRSKIKIHARHLYAKSMEDAQSLASRLAKGETFETLAQEVFQDSALANTGGDLGFFTYDEMDPAFEDAAYGLDDGQISAPVKTAWGYSIIQVIEREYEPLMTEQDYQIHREDFKVKVKKRLLKNKVRKFTSDLADASELQIDDAALQLLFDNLTDIFNTPADRDYHNDQLKDIRLKAKGLNWDIAEITDKLRLTRDIQRRQIRSTDDLFEMLSGLVVREKIFEQIQDSPFLTSKEFELEKNNRQTQRVLTMLVASIQSANGDTVQETEKRRLYIDFINDLKMRSAIEINQELLSSFVL